MKKWLFYTKSNGDVSSRPNDPKAITAEQRRELVGDLGASRFKVINNDQVPVKPVWNASTSNYEGNPKPGYQRERDKLENTAVVKYQGKLIDMSPYSREKFSQVKDSLGRRNKTIQWSCKDVTTGASEKIGIKKQDIEKFEDAMTDAVETLYIQADTQIPDNPWPLEVV